MSQYIKGVVFIKIVTINLLAFSQIIDSNFVYKLTEKNVICRDCHIDDYYVPIILKYDNYIYKTITTNTELKIFLTTLNKDLNFDNVTTYIRNILINKDTLFISKKELNQRMNKSKLLEFLDIWEGDTIFNRLKKNKEEFLNYYFDINGIYKFSNEYILKKTTDKYLHDKIFKFTAIISQLYEWNIPVHFIKEGMKLGYYDNDL